VGFATGAWDVAMNVQAAAVEQRLDRPIMSRFHAGYSLGTVCGALAGAAATALHVSVTIHLSVVAVVVSATTIFAVQRFLDERGGVRASGPPSRVGSAWRERRTLLIGVFVLAFAFAEGTRPTTGSTSRRSTATAPRLPSAASSTPCSWPR
jgi:hypothetical protein